MSISHVVWDWNSTLVDDFDLIVAATAEACQGRLRQPLTAEDYRTHFTRPIQAFYEAIFEREVSPPELSDLSRSFRDRYRSLAVDSRLAPDAIAALDRARAARLGQSLLSMWEHDELVGAVGRLGIQGYFVRVDGQRGMNADGKAALLVDHLEALGAEAASVLMIGDSLDDAAAARHVGAPCVLVEGGSHHPRDLREAGARVAGSLVEALEVGGVTG